MEEMTMTTRSCWFGLLTLLTLHPALGDDASAGAKERPFRLTLPPTVYAIPGVEMNLYFANTVLVAEGQKVAFEVECPLGKVEEHRWTLNAVEQQLGQVPLKLKVKNQSGKVVEEATTQVRIVSAEAGKDRDLTLLIVGDSLTHASAYPNEVARLLALPGNPRWRMIGTHKPAGAAAAVVHEGYGGWTWAAFASRFDPKNPEPGYKGSSPFVFAVGDPPQAKLDVARYFAERAGGKSPDFIIVMLGINDCFGFNPDDAVQLDTQIDGVFKEADKLIAEFRRAAPRATIGICLTTPGNSRDAAFVANYQDRYTRWGWRRIQHRLVERQLMHFGNREAERVCIVPTELNLDVTDGYPENNGVHPNPAGYKQIGTTIYCWLKSRLAE
jgi:lysophospholipase L1-like esterase